jgi:hypothetical protein
MKSSLKPNVRRIGFSGDEMLKNPGTISAGFLGMRNTYCRFFKKKIVI